MGDSRFRAFDRLSSREKLMVGSLGALAVVVVVTVGTWIVGNALASIEEDIQLGEEKMALIEKAATHYVEVKAKQEAIVKLMAENPIVSLRIPINNLAKQVDLVEGKKLSDVIRFEGKTVETPIAAVGEKKGKTTKRNKKGKGKGEEEEAQQNFKIEQDFEFRDVPITALYEFLEKIEKSPELLFVTKLEIRRKFGDYDMAQTAFVTVTTFKHTGTP